MVTYTTGVCSIATDVREVGSGDSETDVRVGEGGSGGREGKFGGAW
jgi:hypothetical protein